MEQSRGEPTLYSIHYHLAKLERMPFCGKSAWPAINHSGLQMTVPLGALRDSIGPCFQFA